MIIKSLTLENFRQFTDKQTITFSTDSKKKSTLVIAENHTGKTTIIESFSWVLYGKTNLVSILNSSIKDSLSSGESTTISGCIELVHGNKDYTVERTQKFTKSGRGISTENKVLSSRLRREPPRRSVVLMLKKKLTLLFLLNFSPTSFSKANRLKRLVKK